MRRSREAMTLSIVLAILILLPYADCLSNAGKTFYQTFNWNQPAVEPQVTHNFILSTDATSCTVTITVDQPPLTTYTVPLTQGTAVVYTLNVASTRGIKLAAPCDFVVYGLNFANESADGWMGIPVESLGNDYMVLSVQPFLPQEPTQLTIVATADNTVCTSYLPNGTTHVSNLNAIQVDYMEGNALDFTGTRVLCNNNVTVYSGQRCSFIPAGCRACDHTVEQIPPKTTLGRNFAMVPLSHNCTATPTCCDTSTPTSAAFCAKCIEIYRVLAVENNTQVSRNGTLTSESFTLQAGQSQYILISQSEFSSLKSTKPILLGQYFNGQQYEGTSQDPAFAIIPQIESYANRYVAATCFPQFLNHFFNLVAPANSASKLLLNGAVFLNQANAVPIPGTNPPLEAYRYQVVCNFNRAGVTVVAPFVIQHSQNQSFGLFAYGFSAWISYGYPGGMNLNQDLYYKCAQPQINVTSTIQSQACNLTNISPPFSQPPIFTDDQCCQKNGTFTYADVTNTTSCQVTITRTWTLTDGCGRTIQATQIAVIQLKQSTYQAPPDANFNGTCVSLASNSNWTGSPTINQTCSSTISVTFTDQTDNATYINRTWVITQQCTNNTLVFNQSITCKPKYFNCAQPQINLTSATIQSQACNLSTSPNFTTPTISSDTQCCQGNASLTYMDKVLNSTSCLIITQRTWNLTDSCGRSVSATQTYTMQKVLDTYQPPTSANSNMTCTNLNASNANTTGVPTVTQSCGTTLSVNFTDIIGGNYINRTWVISQQCTNNTVVFNQNIACKDKFFYCALPQINVSSNTINSQSCNLSSAVPTFGNPSITSDMQCCQGNATLNYTDQTNASACQVTIQRTWTLTDACGRSAQAVQTAVIQQSIDTYQPPPNTNSSSTCTSLNASNANATGTPMVNQTCGTTLSVNFTDIVGGTYINRTWVISQRCTNNTVVFNQNIACKDKYFYCALPQINVSSSQVNSQACNLSSAVPAFGNPSISSDGQCCQGNATLNYTDQTNASACQMTIQRTWTLTDACGRSAQAVQTAVIKQAIDAYQAPPDANSSSTCTSLNASNANTTGVPTVTQSCGTTMSVNFTDVMGGSYINRTWTISQQCTNNTVVFNQNIACKDKFFYCKIPHIYVSPNPVTSQACNLSSAGAPAFGNPIISTDGECCQGNATLNYTDQTNASSCQVTIQRTWTLTDACGRSTQAVQTATIQQMIDTYQPPPSGNSNMTCTSLDASNANATGVPMVIQSCGTTVSVNITDVNGGSYINRTWVISQQCTNDPVVFNQNIACKDKYFYCALPQINVPPNPPNSQACDLSSAVPAFGNPNTSSDMQCCQGNATLDYTDHINASDCQVTITRTWTVTDACVRSAQATQMALIQQMIDTYEAPPDANFNGPYSSWASNPNATGSPRCTHSCGTTTSINCTDETDQDTYVNRTWVISQRCTDRPVVCHQHVGCVHTTRATTPAPTVASTAASTAATTAAVTTASTPSPSTIITTPTPDSNSTEIISVTCNTTDTTSPPETSPCRALLSLLPEELINKIIQLFPEIEGLMDLIDSIDCPKLIAFFVELGKEHEYHRGRCHCKCKGGWNDNNGGDMCRIGKNEWDNGMGHYKPGKGKGKGGKNSGVWVQHGHQKHGARRDGRSKSW